MEDEIASAAMAGSWPDERTGPNEHQINVVDDDGNKMTYTIRAKPYRHDKQPPQAAHTHTHTHTPKSEMEEILEMVEQQETHHEPNTQHLKSTHAQPPKPNAHHDIDNDRGATGLLVRPLEHVDHRSPHHQPKRPR